MRIGIEADNKTVTKLKQLIFMKKRLLSIVWLLAVIVSTFWAFGSLSSANASDVLKLGDVDGNGSVNVADITVLINYLKTPTTKIVATAADANHDGTINASDEAAIANIIMSGTPDQSANSILFFTEATVEKAFGTVFTNTIVLAGSTGAVTYSASPASVATVNATTGEVTCVGAGQATVTATLAADSKYKGATAQYTLNVAKYSSTDPDETMTTMPTAKTSEGGGNLTYTGSAQPLITPGESSAGTIRYKVTTTNTQPLKSDDGWITDVPEATDAGTYYVWYYVSGNDNYSETAVSATPITVIIDNTDSNISSAITNPSVGQVIGSDGKNYNKDEVPEGVTAVATIVYLGSDNGEAAPYNHGLALALKDAGGVDGYYRWNKSKNNAGHTKQTDSSNFTYESGLQYNATHNTYDFPAFKAAINYSTAAPTGCSAWFLASGYQWTKMFAGNANGLKKLAGLTQSNYWSSSESNADEAWYFRSHDGGWNDGDNVIVCHVRSCLAF